MPVTAAAKGSAVMRCYRLAGASGVEPPKAELHSTPMTAKIEPVSGASRTQHAAVLVPSGKRRPPPAPSSTHTMCSPARRGHHGARRGLPISPPRRRRLASALPCHPRVARLPAHVTARGAYGRDRARLPALLSGDGGVARVRGEARGGAARLQGPRRAPPYRRYRHRGPLGPPPRAHHQRHHEQAGPICGTLATQPPERTRRERGAASSAWGADTSAGAPPAKPAPIHHVTGVRMVPSGVKAGYAGTRVISKTRV